jgi:hypothetical protein
MFFLFYAIIFSTTPIPAGEHRTQVILYKQNDEASSKCRRELLIEFIRYPVSSTNPIQIDTAQKK